MFLHTTDFCEGESSHRAKPRPCYASAEQPPIARRRERRKGNGGVVPSGQSQDSGRLRAAAQSTDGVIVQPNDREAASDRATKGTSPEGLPGVGRSLHRRNAEGRRCEGRRRPPLRFYEVEQRAAVDRFRPFLCVAAVSVSNQIKSNQKGLVKQGRMPVGLVS